MPREPDSRVAIGLGSNLGDRADHLRTARQGLAHIGAVTAVSSIWETAPIGPEQPDYLNAVVTLDTVLGPRPVLEHCRLLEAASGRERRERWGPRPLDLDLLLYGDAEVESDDLTVPHPRMHDRRFVLAPLAEVWPDAVVPGHGAIGHLLAAVADQSVSPTEIGWEPGTRLSGG